MGLRSPMTSEKVQLFLWFLAAPEHDEAVQSALQTVSQGLAAEFNEAPALYRRCPAGQLDAESGASMDENKRVSTWMEVHPSVAQATAAAYLERVEQLAIEAGLIPYVRGLRHAEWFTCV